MTATSGTRSRTSRATFGAVGAVLVTGGLLFGGVTSATADAPPAATLEIADTGVVRYHDDEGHRYSAVSFPGRFSCGKGLRYTIYIHVNQPGVVGTWAGEGKCAGQKEEILLKTSDTGGNNFEPGQADISVTLGTAYDNVNVSKRITLLEAAPVVSGGSALSVDQESMPPVDERTGHFGPGLDVIFQGASGRDVKEVDPVGPPCDGEGWQNG